MTQKGLGLSHLFFKGSWLKVQQSWTKTLQFAHRHNPTGSGKLGLWFPFLLSRFPTGDTSIHNHKGLPAASPLAAPSARGLLDGHVTNLPAFRVAVATIRLNSTPQPLAAGSAPRQPGYPCQQHPALLPSKEDGLGALVWLALLRSCCAVGGHSFICPSQSSFIFQKLKYLKSLSGYFAGARLEMCRPAGSGTVGHSTKPTGAVPPLLQPCRAQETAGVRGSLQWHSHCCQLSAFGNTQSHLQPFCKGLSSTRHI